MVLPASWIAVPSDDLVRLGNTHDGGYVLSRAALAPARHLVSMGLNDDWSFESDYLDATQGAVVCFDHTVDAEFWAEKTLKNVLRRRWHKVADFRRYRAFFARPDAEHRRTMVGYDLPGQSVSLRTILAEKDRGEIGLKIDIEGWEYRLLDQLVEEQERIAFLVIEFHDVDLMADRITRFLAAADQLVVVWTHANNFAGVDGSGNPIVLEMSLVARRLLVPGDADTGSAVTTPNDPSSAEIELEFAPA
jgi:hypothetical protein